jgi:uncharacterized protein with NRDE domain
VCTVILLFQVDSSYPIILASNRDEFLDRESTLPHLFEIPCFGGNIRVFAGKDLRAGGTWFGINERGMMAGVTNRFTGARDPHMRSRGNLVLECLSCPDPQTALSHIARQKVERLYNPFNLFCMNLESGFLYTNHPFPHGCQPLPKGVHILTNGPLHGEKDPRKERILQRVSLPPDFSSNRWEDQFIDILKYHGTPERKDSTCIHLTGYGTVSSLFLSVEESWKKSRLLVANGSPCATPFEDKTDDLLRMFS